MEDIHICGCCKHQFRELDSFLAHKRMTCSQTSVPDTVDEVTIYTEGGATLSTNHHVLKTPTFDISSGILHETSANDIASNNASSVQINTNVLSKQTERTPHVRSFNDKNNSKHTVIPVSLVRSSQHLLADDNASSKVNKLKFMCSEQGCDFSARYKKDLIRHNRKHTGDRPYCCKFCTRTFTRSDKLKLHIRYHNGDKPYKCSQCSYAAVDRGSLTKHLRIHSNERPYKCQICDYASRNSSQLVVHLRTHTGDKPFHCQNCSAKFKINSDLNRHMRVHTKEKPYKCHLCNYKCSMKGNLNVHMKNNHLRDKKYVCEDCGTSFCTKRQLKTHMTMHVSFKPFKCLDCDYRCKDKTSFKRHERAHSEDRPYKCEFCDFKAKYISHKQRHMKKAHTEEWKLKKQQRQQDKNLKSKLKDSGHISLPKNATSSFPACAKKKLACTKCDAAFVRKDSLNSHLRQHSRMDEALQSTALAVLQLQETPVVILGEGQSELIDIIPGENPEVTAVRFSVSRGSQEINQILQSVDNASLLPTKDSTSDNSRPSTAISSQADSNECVVSNPNIPTQLENINELQAHNTLEQVVLNTQQPRLIGPPIVIAQVQGSDIEPPVFQVQGNSSNQMTTEKQNTTSNISTDQNVTLHILNPTCVANTTQVNLRPSNENQEEGNSGNCEKTLIPLETLKQKSLTSFSAGLSDVLPPNVVQTPLTIQNLQDRSNYQNLQILTSNNPQRIQLVPVTARMPRKVRPIVSKSFQTLESLPCKTQNVASVPTSTSSKDTLNRSHFQLGEASTVMQRFVDQTRNQNKQEAGKRLLANLPDNVTQLNRNTSNCLT